MIRLNVEEYCQQCLDFVPDVTPAERAFAVDGKEIIQTDTIVQCKYRRRCVNMMRYLEHQAKDEAVG